MLHRHQDRNMRRRLVSGPARTWTTWALPAAGMAVLCGAAPLSCSQPKGHPPIARLTITPRYVPVGQPTDVLLDGSKSCDQVDNPQACSTYQDGGMPDMTCPHGVSFHWTISAPAQLKEGGVDQPRMRILLTTDRPVTVSLTITDCAGRTAEIDSQIGVILPWPDGGASDRDGGASDRDGRASDRDGGT
ncbi:MAG: hypothetical protein J7M25_12755 [Deltaproteobacteria bacterium]|nr:hypothetical protein [Deltaproteobacteria bacterium]